MTVSGPFFDTRLERGMHDMVETVSRDVAKSGDLDVHAHEHIFFRNPTGNYEAHIRTDKIADGTFRVWDGGTIVYGPWLEGVGSRNKTTHFKGYFIMRLVTQGLSGRAKGIADSTIARMIARIN